MILRLPRLRRHISLAVPHACDPPTESVHTPSTPYERKLRSLVHSIESAAGPSAVWHSYMDALNAMGPSAMPLKLHKRVLRHCTPPKAVHRDSVHKSIKAHTFTSPSHKHESRFKTIVQNIASTGAAPDIADYNYILDQLASVGYYSGSYGLYLHMVKIGLEPDAKTFGFCFRALATRLALPIAHEQREDLISHISVIFQQLIQDHQRRAIPMSSPNMDFILRILKDTRDRATFENILSSAYAIDLYNPDRLSLEYTPTAEGPVTKQPLPLTTAALNTTLDLLGRLGDISHLVSAFEVLSQPLPAAAQHFFNSFEDDDDDMSVELPPAPISLAHAPANTTTYSILLRHVSQNGNAVLARHYLVQAIHLERHTSWVLRGMVNHRRSHPDWLAREVPAPLLSMHRLLILPVLGLANRDKNLGLLRWLQSKMPTILLKQRADLKFYQELVAELGLDANSIPEFSISDDEHDINPFDADPDLVETSEPSSSVPYDPTSSNKHIPTLNAQKLFSPLMHMRILQRNLAELTVLSKRIDYVVARTTQRAKERLGRRVWAERDIYLRDEGERRVVARTDWREMVNFRAPREGIQDGYYARARGPFTPNPKPTAKGKDTERKMSTMALGLGQNNSGLNVPPIPVLWSRTRDS